MESGILTKMEVHQADEVAYTLHLNGSDIHMNELIGRRIYIAYSGSIFCLKCGNRTQKSFGQGYCYKCFMEAPENSECIIRPELCRAHLGEGRDPEWEEAHHNQPHIVYLAAADAIKVGVTRNSQVPTRWIDQGAESTIVLCRTPNRFEAGKIEVAMKSLFTDRTNWRNMLTNKMDFSIDLSEKKWELEEVLPKDIAQFISDDEEVFHFKYPVIRYPDKVNSINLDKTPQFERKLMGIRGQYLIFENNQVINIRKYGGYKVEMDVL